MPILFRDLDLVIAIKDIDEWVDFLNTHSLQHFVIEQCHEWIMKACIIQLYDINADSNLTCLLIFHNYGIDPL